MLPNPFVPGKGVIPPFLAGREREQSLVRARLEALADDRPPGTDIILYGPRGNGKTVLLEWSLRQAENRGITVIDVGLGESSQPRVAPSSRLRQWLMSLRSLSTGGASFTWRDLPPAKVAAVMERRARKGPVLVTIDEAHTMPAGLGRAVLSVVQRLQRRGQPAMLLLAGTPDLPRHLSSLGVSFWERSRTLPIGRLSPVDAADVIRVPLEEAARSISIGALDQVVDESQGYPYFLQLWGAALWDGCPDPTIVISQSYVDRARREVRQVQNLFHLRRYDELAADRLLSSAVSVAGLFAGSQHRMMGEVTEAVRSSLVAQGAKSGEQSVEETCRRLQDLGFIWLVNRDGRPFFEPGIPSVMSYVAKAESLAA